MKSEFLKNFPETESAELAADNAARFVEFMQGAGFSADDTAWGLLNAYAAMARRGDRDMWIGELTALLALLKQNETRN